MRRVTIVVIGNGKSTRANVEALISDVADSVDEVMLATVYEKQSEGQVWAEQWAQDKEIPVLQYSDNNYDALFTENAIDELKFFLLWDDEDSACQLAASKAQEYKVPMFDLTDGLLAINLGRKKIAAPAEPPAHEVIEEEQPALISIEEALASDEEEVFTETVELEDGTEVEYTVEPMTVDELILEYTDNLAEAIAKKVLKIVREELAKD